MSDLPDLANLDYVDRVNRAIDHITRNLAKPLNLAKIAKVAAFSPFHFHRIFRAITGETLLEFVKRTRLERSAYLMLHTKKPLTEIALDVGFNSSSDFSRSFKGHFGVSPRAFDLEAWRKERQVMPAVARTSPDDRFTVTLRDLPARRVAYLRVLRPFEKGRAQRACNKLVAWAKERGLEGGQWLGYMWEDPEIVPQEKCRYDVGLEIPEGVALSADVSETRFPPMKVAELEMKGSIELELRALEWLYETWLPRSGYVPDHQPGFEAWNGVPFEHGEDHFELRIQLAVI